MIKLPRFTLINSPNGSGKSTLRALLCAQDDHLMSDAFAEPMRQVLYTTFYPDELSRPDLRDSAVKASNIPGTGVTHRDFLIRFGNEWMKSLFGPYIWADLAKRRCELLSQWWPRFIFDDCRFPEEVDAFLGAYDRKEILLIHISRYGCDFKNANEVGELLLRKPCGHVFINNNAAPEAMLLQLETHLGTLDSSVEPRPVPDSLSPGLDQL